MLGPTVFAKGCMYCAEGGNGGTTKVLEGLVVIVTLLFANAKFDIVDIVIVWEVSKLPPVLMCITGGAMGQRRMYLQG